MNVDTSWWDDNGSAVTIAVVALLVAFVIAQIVDRALRRRADRLTEGVLRGHISRETETRLRFVRRVIYAVILLIGLGIALAQFDGVNRIAASLLASGVVAAAIIGFAARQTLANFVAGVMLAVTQPLRVGDWVKVEDHYGVVEDVRLHYTVLRTAGEQRVLIPNEKLASSMLQNDTLVVDSVGVEVTLWIPPGADAGRAAEILADEGDVAVAEAVPWGVKLAVGGRQVKPPERAGAEAEMRARCHALLREAGLLEGFSQPGRS
jgi:small-conductance mechanosensitive channel